MAHTYGAEIATFHSSQNQSCKLKEDFPGFNRGTPTAYGVLEGVPLICGGRDSNADVVFQDCDAIGHPHLNIQMLEKREWTSGIVLNYPAKTLWITGGLTKVNDGTSSLKSTEFVYLNKQSERGPDLPIEICKHCMIKYNDSTVFIIGGVLGADIRDGRTTSKTWIVDPTSNFQIREGPSLPSAKRLIACGKMIIGGKTWLVVGPDSPSEGLDLLDPLNVNQGWLRGIYFFENTQYL